MLRMLSLLLIVGLAASGGCAICQNCFDDAYPHYGSIAPRTERNYGRVGSVFAPAGPDVGVVEPYRRESTQADLPTPAINQELNKPKPDELPDPEDGPDQMPMSPLQRPFGDEPLRPMETKAGSLTKR